MRTDTFEYGGYHFTPVRQFEKRDGDFFQITRNTSLDVDMGFTTFQPRQKFPYSHKDFYAASSAKECDLFRCEENGRLYLPGENELFVYHDPLPKEHTAEKTTKAAKRRSTPER